MKTTHKLSLAAALLLAASQALALPTATVSFPRPQEAPNTPMKMRITLANPDTVSYSFISLNVSLYAPGYANVSGTPVVLNGCAPFGGTAAASPGSTGASLSLPLLAAGNSCAVEVEVTGSAWGPQSFTVPPGGFTGTTPAFANGAAIAGTVNVIPTLVTNTADGGPGSMLLAIQQMNGNCATYPVVNFDIPGAGPHSIFPSIGMPPITCDGGVINGYSQPGAVLNNQFPGNDAVLKIILNGAACSGCDGLVMLGNNATVQGLSIHSFGNFGIHIWPGTSGNTVVGNYLGLDPGGNVFGNGYNFGGGGVGAFGTSSTVGGFPDGNANLIAGNQLYQVLVEGAGSIVAHNAIGVNRAGATVASPGYGIWAGTGSGITISSNDVRGNAQGGIDIGGSSNSFTIDGNVLGGNGGSGLYLGGNSHSASFNLVGFNSGNGISAGGNFQYLYGNSVHDNSGDGIALDGFGHEIDSNTVYGNIGGAGIRLTSGEAFIHGNNSFGNAGPGVKLGGGNAPLPNDDPDVIAGPNDSLNTPVITSAVKAGGVTTVSGTVKASPVGRNGFVQVYANGAPSSNTEGETYYGDVAVTLDASGQATWSVTIPERDFVSAQLHIDACGDACWLSSEHSPTFTSTLGAGTIVTASPAFLSYPDQQVGTNSAPRVISFTNGGPANIEVYGLSATGDFFFVSSNCFGSLAVGATCSAQVEFRPIASGARSGLFTFSSSASNGTLTVGMSGNGIGGARGAIAVEPASLDFGAVNVFETSATPQVVRVSNTGAGPLEFRFGVTSEEFSVRQPSSQIISEPQRQQAKATEVALPSGQFTTCTGTLDAGAFCEVVLDFKPMVPGVRSGLLLFESNAENRAPDVRLAGFGVAAGQVVPTRPLTVPPVIAFDNQVIATQSTGIPLSIVNTTGSRISFSELAISSGDFTLGGGCTAVEAGATCERMVFFKPTALGPRTARITLRSATEAEAYLVEVTGTGIPNPLPQLAVAPVVIGFGNVTGPVSSVVTLTNTGQLPVALQPLRTSGGFTATTECPAILPVGGTCTVKVNLLTGVQGIHQGDLFVTSDAERSPHRVELSARFCRPPSGMSRTQRTSC